MPRFRGRGARENKDTYMKDRLSNFTDRNRLAYVFNNNILIDGSNSALSVNFLL